MYRWFARSLIYTKNLNKLENFQTRDSFKISNEIKFFSCCKTLNQSEKATDKNLDVETKEHNLPSSLNDNYKLFRDEDAPIIFDVNEEKKRIALNELKIEEDIDPYEGINMTRGVNGVFEIEDLVELLRRDNARQIFVATVPKEYSYVDYIVVVSGKTPRHMNALATFVRKIFKMKKHKSDNIPKIEGKDSKDWLALDLGNIALHILSPEARLKYDLETLWSVGSEYDDISNIKDDEIDIMDKYKDFLKEFQPAR